MSKFSKILSSAITANQAGAHLGQIATVDLLSDSPEAKTGKAIVDTVRKELNINEADVTADVLSATVQATFDAEGTLNKIREAARQDGAPVEIAEFYDTLSFNGMGVEKQAELSYGFNSVAAKQDEYAEAFFKTVVLPVGTVIFKNQVVVPYFTQTIDHDGKGKRPKYVSINKTYNSVEATLGADKLAIVPVVGVNDELDAYLVTEARYPAIDPVTDTDIESAPIKTGIEVPLADVSQSKAAIVKGYLNTRDTLNREVPVKALVAEVDDGNGGKKYVKIPTEHLANARYDRTTSGDDLGLRLDVQQVIYRVAVADLKTTKGESVADLFPHLANKKVAYKVTLSGGGDVVSKVVTLYVNNFSFEYIEDAEGNRVPTTDANYNDMKAEAEKLSAAAIKGAILEASLVNDNLRRKGRRITTKPESSNIGIRPFSPYIVEISKKAINSDVDAIEAAGSEANRQFSAAAVKTLLETADKLRGNLAASIDEDGVYYDSPITKMVKPVFVEETIELQTVSSTSNSGRKEDIAALINDTVAVMVPTLIRESRIKGIIKGDIEVVIGLGSSFQGFVDTKIDLGNGIVPKFVFSDFDEAQDVVNITLNPAAPSKDYDARTFGTFFFCPSLVFDVERTGDDVYREYVVMPQGVHYVNTYILGQIRLSGLADSVKIVAQNYKNV